MTGKKVIALLTAAALLCGLAGCGNKETENSVPESVSSVPQSIPNAETSISQSSVVNADSTGSPDAQSAPTASETAFDFDEAVKNITLFGQKISLPCTIADFGNDFSLDDPSDILVFESLGSATSHLYYRGDIIGTVNLPDYKENDLPENKQIVSLSLGFPDDYGYANEEERKNRFEAYGQFSGLIPLDFAGVSFTSTQNEIIDKLGVPTDNIEDNTYGVELRTINYNISDRKGIYLFLADNKPYWIVITCD